MTPILLDAYAARSCPVKTQNQFNPLLGTPPQPELDESVVELFNGGVAHEQSVLAQVAGMSDGRVVDVRGLRDQPWQIRERATMAAMDAGADLIIGGTLPVDEAGHRRGSCELYVRGAPTSTGAPGYQPVVVKAHRVLEKCTLGPEAPRQKLSRLSKPYLAAAMDMNGLRFRMSSREADLLQLAHAWRLLDAAGHAADGEPWAGIIGTDTTTGLGQTVSWVRLDRKEIRTFSRTSASGWTRRSPLERYDHEHGFRVKVAQNASAQTGRPDDPPLMVSPIRVHECSRCIWWQVCRPQLADDDLSLRIDKSPLDVREVSVLRRLGITTITDLARIDLEGFLPTYLPEAAHRVGAEQRLRLAAHRASLMVTGVELERTSREPIVLPEVDVEVDVDIENSAADGIYLWGFLVHDRRTGSGPRYVPFADFSELNTAQELHLARTAMAWLRDLVAEVGADRVRVYHYSDYERVRLARLAQESVNPPDDDPLAWAVDFARTGFVDLFSLMRRHFFGTHGLGLKQTAHAATGFTWRDDDPGGLNSQRWFDEAVHSPSDAERDEASRRVLDYNEDDVRATWALRAWLRTLDDPPTSADGSGGAHNGHVTDGTGGHALGRTDRGWTDRGSAHHGPDDDGRGARAQ